MTGAYLFTPGTGDPFTVPASTLGGYGTILGAVSVSGILNPKFHAEKTLTFARGLTLNDGARIVFDTNSTFAVPVGQAIVFPTGSEFWTLSLGGIAADWDFDSEASMLLFTYDTAQAGFSMGNCNFDLFGRTSGFSFDTSTTPGQVWLLGVAAIPEPASLVLLGLGLGMIALLRRKKVS